MPTASVRVESIPECRRGVQRAIERNPDARGMTTREYWQKFVVPNTPALLKKEITPEDIGHAVVFLASEDARTITGQSLSVDCGLYPAWQQPRVDPEIVFAENRLLVYTDKVSTSLGYYKLRGIPFRFTSSTG
ncbi:MAG: SDR family oxidoreductase [Dehalococcoidales bacterium]|nr:SDR family oxidoreductase [Dehalococcoidales bacterium]